MSIKISHHTDPRNPKRTLTLARETVRLEGGAEVIHVGYAINHVPEVGSREIYDRKQGNSVAVGRCQSKSSITVSLLNGEDPRNAVNAFFASKAKTAKVMPKEAKAVPYKLIAKILGL